MQQVQFWQTIPLTITMAVELGSVRALVGDDGVPRNQYEYDDFGMVVSTLTGATDDSRYRYTGREFDV